MQDLLEHSRSRKFFVESKERPLKRETKGNIWNYSNFGKKVIDIIVNVYIKAIKNVWMQIQRSTTKNLLLLV